MKPAAIFLLVFVLLVSLCGCDKSMGTTDALIEKAREEFSAAEGDEVILAGQCVVGSSALFWFIKNDYSHLLMECTLLDNGGYTFERSYKNPTERGTDIYVNPWQAGYVYLVNNPNCAAIEITDRSGTYEVPIDPGSHPFLYRTDSLPQEYHFFDGNGNEIS